VSLDQYPPWPDLLRWLTAVKDRVEQVVAIGAEQVITGELDPDVIPPIPWDRVLKADSSLGDLETRSAGDLSSGTLLDARMPALTGDVSSVVGTVETLLATVNLNPGTYGAGHTIPVISVNGKGLVTDAFNQSIETGALTKVDDTNVTLTLTGTPATALLEDVTITVGWSGALSLNRGGTGRLAINYTTGDLLVKSVSSSVLSVIPAVAVGSVMASKGIATVPAWDSNPTLSGIILTTPLFMTYGGTGTATTFAQGSVVFADVGGVYTQDNANFFWDDTNNRLGIGTASPTAVLHLKAGTATANTAPIKLTSGTNLTTAEAGAIEFTTDDYFATITTGAARKGIVLDDGARLTSGKIAVATTNGRLIDGPTLGAAGLKIPAIQGSGRSTAQVAAVASVATFTVGAADASFLVSANVNVTTSTVHTIAVQVDYTDETNTAQTLTLTFSQLSAALVSSITNVTGAGPYEGLSLQIRCKASTAITVKTTGVFTTVTYNVEGVITQLT
jgi:hypothetical protein